MSFTNDTAKRIAPYMKSRGFKRKGRRFYYVQNDIAFCIDLTMPTDCVYVPAYILPLYMPFEYIILEYGVRLGNMPAVMLPLLWKTDDEEQIKYWCALLCSRIEDTILPIFRSISTPEKLSSYIEIGRDYRQFIRGSELSVESLRIYTHLYLHDLEQAAATIIRYESELKNCTYLTANAIQRRLTELQSLKALINAKEEELSRFFQEIIVQTSKLFP